MRDVCGDNLGENTMFKRSCFEIKLGSGRERQLKFPEEVLDVLVTDSTSP